MPEILDIATDKMNKTINVMKSEYNSLRAGRATLPLRALLSGYALPAAFALLALWACLALRTLRSLGASTCASLPRSI